MKSFKSLLIIALFSAALCTLPAQIPPHPNGGNDPGGSSTQVGGGSPIGGGLAIMIALSVGYVTRKVYDMRSKAKENE